MSATVGDSTSTEESSEVKSPLLSLSILASMLSCSSLASQSSLALFPPPPHSDHVASPFTLPLYRDYLHVSVMSVVFSHCVAHHAATRLIYFSFFMFSVPKVCHDSHVAKSLSPKKVQFQRSISCQLFPQPSALLKYFSI